MIYQERRFLNDNELDNLESIAILTETYNKGNHADVTICDGTRSLILCFGTKNLSGLKHMIRMLKICEEHIEAKTGD